MFGLSEILLGTTSSSPLRRSVPSIRDAKFAKILRLVLSPSETKTTTPLFATISLVPSFALVDAASSVSLPSSFAAFRFASKSTTST